MVEFEVVVFVNGGSYDEPKRFNTYEEAERYKNNMIFQFPHRSEAVIYKIERTRSS